MNQMIGNYRVYLHPDLTLEPVPNKRLEVKLWHAHHTLAPHGNFTKFKVWANGSGGYYNRVNKKWLKRYGTRLEMKPNPMFKGNQAIIMGVEKAIHMTESMYREVRKTMKDS